MEFLNFPWQCYTLGVEDLALLSGEELHAPGSFLVMFNGLILGKHRQPKVHQQLLTLLHRLYMHLVSDYIYVKSFYLEWTAICW